MSDEEAICVCGKPYRPGCRNQYGGGGNIITLNKDLTETVTICPNMKAKMFRLRLEKVHPLLLKVPAIEEATPLYVGKNKKTGQERVDLTTENLFFPSTDFGLFLAHLKKVLAYKAAGNFFVKVTTDMTIRDVFVGSQAFRARTTDQREDLPICNSIADLVEGPDLVIIRLGHIRYKNIAIADNLQETLILRRGLGKATWLIEPPDLAFTPFHLGEFGMHTGMPCCNDSSYNYVQNHFEQIVLDSVEGAYIEEPQYYLDAETDTVALLTEGPTEFMEVADRVAPKIKAFEEVLEEEEEDDTVVHANSNMNADIEEFMGLGKKEPSWKKKKKGGKY